MCLSRGHRDVRPPVQMTLTPTAFSRVSTWDSDMSSSCKMKDEPEFIPLQGNRAFFGDRAFRGPFHLRQKTQGIFHMATAEGKLLLRCLWKVGSHLQAKTGNQISSWDDMVCIELSSSCCTEINIHMDETAVSGNL